MSFEEFKQEIRAEWLSKIDNYDYFSNTKIKMCGNMVHCYEFQKPFRLGKRPLRAKKYRREPVQYTEKEKRNMSLRRARTKLSDYINTNCWAWKNERGRNIRPVFLTLTFAENMTDIEKANYELTKFFRRFNYEFFETKESVAKYAWVMEFQKRGAIHYHIVIFNLPFAKRIIDRMERIWPAGFFQVKAVRTSDVGRYICKYMSKDFYKKGIKGKKSYAISRGLKKPIVVNVQELANLVWKEIPPEAETWRKENIPVPFLRYFSYYQYDLRGFRDAKRKILALAKEFRI